MRLKGLGEFGVIEMIRRMLDSAGTGLDIGDDCAVLPFNRRNLLLFTCDMLIENEDFTPQDRLYLVGRKSLGCCLSDIAACGGVPCYAQVCLGLPSDMPVSKMRSLYRGIVSQAKEFKVKIVGGDISKSDRVVIDVSLIGMVEKGKLVLRGGAREGDIIFVSNKLGGSIYGRHLRFKPRIKESRYLVNNYKVNSMIDISDGLIQDLGHILHRSNKGAVLFKELIPVCAQADSLQDALYMGEDFELLFTLSGPEAKRLVRSSYADIFAPIGEIVAHTHGLVLLDEHARRLRLKRSGFRHF